MTGKVRNHDVLRRGMASQKYKAELVMDVVTKDENNGVSTPTQPTQAQHAIQHMHAHPQAPHGGITSGHMAGYQHGAPAVPQQNTVYCNYCSVQLSYPTGSMYIQCPKCRNVMNPVAPQQTNCIGCTTPLAHPPTSLYIQCPKCLTIMNAREGGSRAGSIDTYYEQAPSQNAPPKKKKRDPAAPKAASNAYMIFSKEMRPKLKAENPDLSFGKIGARLGEIWRSLSVEEKKPYEDFAAGDRDRYKEEMDSYHKGTFVDPRTKAKSKTDESTTSPVPESSDKQPEAVKVTTLVTEEAETPVVSNEKPVVIPVVDMKVEDVKSEADAISDPTVSTPDAVAEEVKPTLTQELTQTE